MVRSKDNVCSLGILGLKSKYKTCLELINPLNESQFVGTNSFLFRNKFKIKFILFNYDK